MGTEEEDEDDDGISSPCGGDGIDTVRSGAIDMDGECGW